MFRSMTSYSTMMVYTKGEELLVYRVINLYGWNQGIYNHVTVSGDFFIGGIRLLHVFYQSQMSQDTEHF